MKDITALEAKYSSMLEATKELGAEIEALKSAKVKEWPQVGDKYYFISGDGAMSYNLWNSHKLDWQRKALGNVFHTEEAVTKERETRKTIAELRAQPGRKKFCITKPNYCVKVQSSTDTCDADWFSGADLGFASTYFESAGAVESAIKAVGADRIITASKWLSMGE